MRVDYSKYILRTTDLPMEQICDMCGYLNEVHFYWQFKKLTGTSPAKYRKSTAEEE